MAADSRSALERKRGETPTIAPVLVRRYLSALDARKPGRIQRAHRRVGRASHAPDRHAACCRPTRCSGCTSRKSASTCTPSTFGSCEPARRLCRVGEGVRARRPLLRRPPRHHVLRRGARSASTPTCWRKAGITQTRSRPRRGSRAPSRRSTSPRRRRRTAKLAAAKAEPVAAPRPSQTEAPARRRHPRRRRHAAQRRRRRRRPAGQEGGGQEGGAIPNNSGCRPKRTS